MADFPIVPTLVLKDSPFKTAHARLLIYSATQRFRHDSIPTAIEQLKSKVGEIDVEFDSTEDQTQFSDANLAKYDGILFLSTTGEGEWLILSFFDNCSSYCPIVLDDVGKSAFQKYLNQGGTFVGIHSSSDTLRNTTFYVKELGTFQLPYKKIRQPMCSFRLPCGPPNLREFQYANN